MPAEGERVYDILITNDDGIDSDGIVRLAEAAARFGNVWVVAPTVQNSAVSHSITLRHSITVRPHDLPVEGVRAFSCSGTPADCVRVAGLSIMPRIPDMVFSGINYGYNVATDIQYSATAGAAFEAAFQKIHTIAFSEDAVEMHEVTDRYLEDIMAELIDKPLELNQIWNVNFPGCPLSKCGGVLYERKVSHDDFYKDHYIETPLPDGKTRYTVEGVRHWEASEGTDLKAILDNFVSVGIATNIS